MISVLMLISALPVCWAGVTSLDTWWRWRQHDCKEMPRRKQSPCSQLVRIMVVEARPLYSTPFWEPELGDQCHGMEVLVYGWGKIQPLSHGIFRFWSSLCSSSVIRQGKSKNLLWELITVEGDGQICLVYISVLSMMEIIKRAEQFSVGNAAELSPHNQTQRRGAGCPWVLLLNLRYIFTRPLTQGINMRGLQLIW